MYGGLYLIANQATFDWLCNTASFHFFIGSISAQGSYREGAWPIHINDLNCTGSEESVWECPHNGIEGYSCNHYQDASVMCQGN